MRRIVIVLAVILYYVTVNAQNIKYTYDNLKRVVKVQYSDSSSITYTYDAAGNRITKRMSNPCFNAIKPLITASGLLTFCKGDSVILTSSMGSQYIWSNGNTSQSITVYESGNYYVSRKDNAGCSKISDTIYIKVTPNPGNHIIALGSTTFCEGGSVVLESSDSIDTYKWSTGATTRQINANAAGKYSVTVSDQNGCSGKDSIVTTVNPLPLVDAGNDTSILEDNSATIGGNPTASGNAPFIYSWLPVTGLDSVTVSNPVASPSNTTSYAVTVTDRNGCTNKDSMILTALKCSYSLSDASYQFESTGGSHNINIIANYNLCSWQVNNANNWLHITPLISQTGNGTITIAVDSCFEDSSRTGSFSVAGHTYTVIQKCQKPEPGFKIYPNPTHSNVIISGTAIVNDDYAITVMDIMGKQLSTYKIAVTNHQLFKQINLQPFANGVYLIHIQANSFKKAYKVEKL